MKAWVKGIITGAVIAAIGVAVLIGGLWLNGWKLPNADYDYEIKAYAAENTEISALELDIDAGTVRTEFYDGETVTVDYPECEAFGYSITENNGRLEISTVDKSFWHWFKWKPVNVPETVVKLPRGGKFDIEAHLNAGEVKLADGEYGKVQVKLNAGIMTAGDFVCDSFYAKLNAGTVKASSVKCNESFITDIDAGYVSANNIECRFLKCLASAGTAAFNSISADETVINISAGKLSASFAAPRSEYNINVNKSAGSCNVDTAYGTTDKTISVKISAGTVNLYFAA